MSAHEQTEKDRATSAAIDDAIRGRTLGRSQPLPTAQEPAEAPASGFDGGARMAMRQPPSGAEIDEQIRHIFNNKPRFGHFAG